MLIYDANQKSKNSPETAAMEAYLKGVYDAMEFKEEDHPRGGKGSEEGGRFVKSEKTKRKEDEDVDGLQKPETQEDGVKTFHNKEKGYTITIDETGKATYRNENGQTYLLGEKGFNTKYSGHKKGEIGIVSLCDIDGEMTRRGVSETGTDENGVRLCEWLDENWEAK